MKEIRSKSHTNDEFHVIDLSEPTRLVFEKMVEGFIISAPDGEILFGWDYDSPEDFTIDNAMLLKPFDNMKEFKKITYTHLYFMPKEKGKIIKVYVCIQK